MPAPVSFDYAVIRVVPRVERGEFINAGVIVFSRSFRFLAARVALDPARLRALAPRADIDEVERSLAVIPLICSGHLDSGPVGRFDRAARFHWLVSPRSTVIQTSPVHSGICLDPRATLDHLVQVLVMLSD